MLPKMNSQYLKQPSTTMGEKEKETDQWAEAKYWLIRGLLIAQMTKDLALQKVKPQHICCPLSRHVRKCLSENLYMQHAPCEDTKPMSIYFPQGLAPPCRFLLVVNDWMFLFKKATEAKKKKLLFFCVCWSVNTYWDALECKWTSNGKGLLSHVKSLPPKSASPWWGWTLLIRTFKVCSLLQPGCQLQQWWKSIVKGRSGLTSKTRVEGLPLGSWEPDFKLASGLKKILVYKPSLPSILTHA